MLVQTECCARLITSGRLETWMYSYTNNSPLHYQTVSLSLSPALPHFSLSPLSFLGFRYFFSVICPVDSRQTTVSWRVHVVSNQIVIVTGTLAVDGWAVTIRTARRGLGGYGPAQLPPLCTKCNSPPINGQCTNFILLFVITLRGELLGLYQTLSAVYYTSYR